MLEKAQPTLEEVQQQFEEWRRVKGRRERIPPALWEAVASLSGQHSVYRISKRLRLHYQDLKNRVGANKKDDANQRPKGSASIKLDMISPRAAGEYLIEMEKPSGARIETERNQGLASPVLGRA